VKIFLRKVGLLNGATKNCVESEALKKEKRGIERGGMGDEEDARINVKEKKRL